MNHGLPIVSFKKCMHSLHNRMISNTWFHYKFWHISQILSGYIKRLKFVFVLNCAVIIVHCGCVECFSSVPKNAQLRIYYAQISKSDAEAIGPHEDLLTIVERRKMQWYGHVSRSSGQNRLARHSEREKKTRQSEEEVGRQHQGMDRPGVRQVPQCSGEQGEMEETGCKIIGGVKTSLYNGQVFVWSDRPCVRFWNLCVIDPQLCALRNTAKTLYTSTMHYNNSTI